MLEREWGLEPEDIYLHSKTKIEVEKKIEMKKNIENFKENNKSNRLITIRSPTDLDCEK